MSSSDVSAAVARALAGRTTAVSNAVTPLVSKLKAERDAAVSEAARHKLAYEPPSSEAEPLSQRLATAQTAMDSLRQGPPPAGASSATNTHPAGLGDGPVIASVLGKRARDDDAGADAHHAGRSLGPQPLAAEPAPITLRVWTMDGAEMIFKLKRSTRFLKVFEAFASKRGVLRYGYDFMFQGKPLGETDTPDDFDMTDGDLIQAYMAKCD